MKKSIKLFDIGANLWD